MGRKRLIAAISLGAALVAPSVAIAAPSVDSTKFITRPGSSTTRFNVVLKDNQPGTVSAQSVSATSQSLTQAHKGKLKQVFSHALNGFTADMSVSDAKKLSADPKVAFVEADTIVHADTQQVNPINWGLDRIDQPSLPLDARYNYTNDGSGVTAYVIDSGIRITHSDFGARAHLGYDAIHDGNLDCAGHGTHVAGIIGGKAAGVAKNISLVSVRVLDCTGSGPTSNVIAGVDWVTAHHTSPAVANLSLSTGLNSPSDALDAAVQRMIASGVSTSISAGNDNADSDSSSPQRVHGGVIVGSTESNDARSSFSNFGPNVDVFAPGGKVVSDWYLSDTSIANLSGTSMAAPFVAGVVANYLQTHPTASPSATQSFVVSSARASRVTGLPSGTPNRLLANASDASSSTYVSTLADRSNAKLANGLALTGALYFEQRASVPLSSVKFYLDGSATAFRTDTAAPFDLVGNAADGSALPLNIGQIKDGSHTLKTVAVTTSGGTIESSITFSYRRAASTDVMMLSSTDRSTAKYLPAGTTLSGSNGIFIRPLPGLQSVSYYFDDTAKVRAAFATRAAPFDLGGTTATGEPILLDTTRLFTGAHTLTMKLTFSDGTVENITRNFSVSNTKTGVYYSTSSTLSGGVQLKNKTVTGTIYPYQRLTINAVAVTFQIGTRVYNTDFSAPFQLFQPNATTPGLKTSSIVKGAHTMKVDVIYANGFKTTETITFNTN